MKLYDLGLFLILCVLIGGNALQYQSDYDRCKASDFKESKCKTHKRIHERSKRI